MFGRIFAHRGYWYPALEPNSLEAITKALSLGFSVETDLRDRLGQIVVSHDPPADSGTFISLREILNVPRFPNSTLALNVKSDGLTSILEEDVANAFFFDMSAPEALKYSRAGLDFALRVSDFEPQTTPAQLKPKWLWLDAFDNDWFFNAPLPEFNEFRGVVVVSPELHGRDKEAVWGWLAERWNSIPQLCVCTDQPEDFERFLRA